MTFYFSGYLVKSPGLYGDLTECSERNPGAAYGPEGGLSKLKGDFGLRISECGLGI